LIERVSEHLDAGPVGCDEPVIERVENERGVFRVLKEAFVVQLCLTPSAGLGSSVS
jgi:hypothetical protein